MKFRSTSRPFAAVLAGIFVLCGLTYGQSDPNPRLSEGVKPHEGVDAMYRVFDEGYRTLDARKVADLYTSDASYLVPEQEIRIGRVAIFEGFDSSFARTKARGETCSIGFDIRQREIGKDMGFDVGIYTVKYYKDGEVVRSARGKFVVVVVKDRDGKWRFQVDGYSGLPSESQD